MLGEAESTLLHTEVSFFASSQTEGKLFLSCDQDLGWLFSIRLTTHNTLIPIASLDKRLYFMTGIIQNGMPQRVLNAGHLPIPL